MATMHKSARIAFFGGAAVAACLMAMRYSLPDRPGGDLLEKAQRVTETGGWAQSCDYLLTSANTLVGMQNTPQLPTTKLKRAPKGSANQGVALSISYQPKPEVWEPFTLDVARGQVDVVHLSIRPPAVSGGRTYSTQVSDQARVSFSPDGRWVVASAPSGMSSSGICVVDMHAVSLACRLLPPAYAFNGKAAWTADGNHALLFAHRVRWGSSSAVLLDTATGATHELNQMLPDAPESAVLLNGSTLRVCEYGGAAGLRVTTHDLSPAPTTLSTSVIATTSTGIQCPALSPDGSRVAWLQLPSPASLLPSRFPGFFRGNRESAPCQVWMANADGSHRHLLGLLPQDDTFAAFPFNSVERTGPHLQWSGDGRKLTFTSRGFLYAVQAN